MQMTAPSLPPNSAFNVCSIRAFFFFVLLMIIITFIWPTFSSAKSLSLTLAIPIYATQGHYIWPLHTLPGRVIYTVLEALSIRFQLKVSTNLIHNEVAST